MRAMSIREYLHQLDDSQLDSAIEIANEIKTIREEEETVHIWVVSGGGLNHAAFEINDYQQAVKTLIKVVEKTAELYPNKRMNLEIRRHEIRESELEKWLELKSFMSPV